MEQVKPEVNGSPAPKINAETPNPNQSGGGGGGLKGKFHQGNNPGPNQQNRKKFQGRGKMGGPMQGNRGPMKNEVHTFL